MPGNRGPKLSYTAKATINQKARESKLNRRALAVELQHLLINMGEVTEERPPSLETLEKMISSARNNNDPEDKPWSVPALADYNIPPEALPIVMKAWAKALVDDDPLTIRQVKWIARLCYIYKGETDRSLEYLIVKASEYASREKAIKLTGAYPDKPQNMRWLWFGDAFLYLDITDKENDKEIKLAKSLMAMYDIGYEVKKEAHNDRRE